MELNLQNPRKKNKKSGKSFDINNATKTFKKLVEKHRKEKIKNKIINFNKTDEFFNTLTNVFFKEEIKENDFDYIFREIKNQIKQNQNMVDKYGINATKKIMPITRQPIKYNKNLIINPLINEGKKEISYSYFFSNKNKNNKKVNLPCIIKKDITIINNTKDSPVKKLFDKDVNKKDDNKKKNNDLNNIKIKTSNSSNDYNYNYYNTFSNERYKPNKSFNFFSKTNNMLIPNRNRNNNSTFTFGNKSTYSFDRSEYLQTLDSLNDQIKYNRRRHRIYFNSNDYGCELFKSKYNYIHKNYFS